MTAFMAGAIVFAGNNASAEQFDAQAAPVKIDAEHFPDTVFMTSIQGYDNDKDGYLSEQEAGAITSLNYDGGDYKAWKELSSLKGIEYLTSLESICLGYNNIKELDLTGNEKPKSTLLLRGKNK